MRENRNKTPRRLRSNIATLRHIPLSPTTTTLSPHPSTPNRRVSFYAHSMRGCNITIYVALPVLVTILCLQLLQMVAGSLLESVSSDLTLTVFPRTGETTSRPTFSSPPDCPVRLLPPTLPEDGGPPPVCYCTPLLEIRCHNLDSVPEFIRPVPPVVDGGMEEKGDDRDDRTGTGRLEGPTLERVAVIYSAIYMAHQSILELPQAAFANVNTRKIVLNFNPLRDVISASAFAGCGRYLRELALGRCKIQNLPDGLLAGLDELTHLHLWANQIHRIPSAFFKSGRNLRELLLWGNKITDVDENTFAGLWKLRRLDLDRNRIKALNREVFRHLAELRVLRLSGNSIHTLYGETFTHLRGLRSLSLDGNSLEFLYAKTFDGMSNLSELMLDDNRISFLPNDVFGPLPNLTTIRLSNNQLEFVWSKTFGGLKSLTSLYLRGNKLKVIPDGVLRKSTSLRQLFLENNDLEGMNKCVFPKGAQLRTLSLVGNPLICNCRLIWLLDIRADGGTIWGTCGTTEQRGGKGHPSPLRSILVDTSYRTNSYNGSQCGRTPGLAHECFV